MPLFRMRVIHKYSFSIEAKDEDEAIELAGELEYENDDTWAGCKIDVERRLNDDADYWEKEPVLEVREF